MGKGQICITLIFRWHYQACARISGVKRQQSEAEAAARKNKLAAPPPLSSEHKELKRKAGALARFHGALLDPEKARELTGKDIAGVPLKQLALASQRCGAHARAMRYYETCLRHHKRELSNEARGVSGIEFSDTEVRASSTRST